MRKAKECLRKSANRQKKCNNKSNLTPIITQILEMKITELAL
jgi:hypothetical protein